jgi:hypothetical protein
MLGFASLFLINLLVSVAAIWLYRSVSGWQGNKHIKVVRKNQTKGRKLTTQFGYISPFSASQKGAQYRKLYSPTGDIKTPWGW